MPNVTLSISDDLKKKMDSIPAIKWSEVFRSIIIRKIKQLEKFEKMVERGEI